MRIMCRNCGKTFEGGKRRVFCSRECARAVYGPSMNKPKSPVYDMEDPYQRWQVTQGRIWIPIPPRTQISQFDIRPLNPLLRSEEPSS